MPTIYEKGDCVYNGTDIYHRILGIVYKHPSVDLENIKYGNPNCRYKDTRNPIDSVDFTKNDNNKINKALKVINAVRYSKTDIEEKSEFLSVRPYGISKCIFNDDW